MLRCAGALASADLLHQKDYAIRCLCDDKFNATLELLELFAKDDIFGGVSYTEKLFFFCFFFDAKCLLWSALWVKEFNPAGNGMYVKKNTETVLFFIRIQLTSYFSFGFLIISLCYYFHCTLHTLLRLNIVWQCGRRQRAQAGSGWDQDDEYCQPSNYVVR